MVLLAYSMRILPFVATLHRQYRGGVFRPCIDLRHGKVVQIVGGTLSDHDVESVQTNFTSDRSPAWFVERYRSDRLAGGHVIKLGPGNDAAARQALAAWPGGMQIGGGITADNASTWLAAGASHVIVTSWLFVDGHFVPQRLDELVAEVGVQRIVIDLSCRWRNDSYWVVTDRWQRFSELVVDAETLAHLADSCAEFLVHGVDVEGLSQGIERPLVELLAANSPLPCTYAGGARTLEDLRFVTEISDGRVDLTIGSALDLFGGSGVRYQDCVEFNRSYLRLN